VRNAVEQRQAHAQDRHDDDHRAAARQAGRPARRARPSARSCARSSPAPRTAPSPSEGHDGEETVEQIELPLPAGTTLAPGQCPSVATKRTRKEGSASCQACARAKARAATVAAAHALAASGSPAAAQPVITVVTTPGRIVTTKIIVMRRPVGSSAGRADRRHAHHRGPRHGQDRHGAHIHHGCSPSRRASRQRPPPQRGLGLGEEDEASKMPVARRRGLRLPLSCNDLCYACAMHVRERKSLRCHGVGDDGRSSEAALVRPRCRGGAPLLVTIMLTCCRYDRGSGDGDGRGRREGSAK
jgi:hypothetical protein